MQYNPLGKNKKIRIKRIADLPKATVELALYKLISEAKNYAFKARISDKHSYYNFGVEDQTLTQSNYSMAEKRVLWSLKTQVKYFDLLEYLQNNEIFFQKTDDIYLGDSQITLGTGYRKDGLLKYNPKDPNQGENRLHWYGKLDGSHPFPGKLGPLLLLCLQEDGKIDVNSPSFKLAVSLVAHMSQTQLCLTEINQGLQKKQDGALRGNNSHLFSTFINTNNTPDPEYALARNTTELIKSTEEYWHREKYSGNLGNAKNAEDYLDYWRSEEFGTASKKALIDIHRNKLYI